MFAEVKINCFKGLGEVSISGLRGVNVFIGRNNAGKSTVLHALEMVGLAAHTSHFDAFPFKHEVNDLLWQEELAIELGTDTGGKVTVTASRSRGPTVDLAGVERTALSSLLIVPDGAPAMLHRSMVAPINVMEQMASRRLGTVNALDILAAVRHYSEAQEKGFSPSAYSDMIREVSRFFPEFSAIESARTERLIATVRCVENGRKLDVLYTGSGFQRLLDIITRILLARPSLVMLDEPEFGLHPDLQRRLLEFLQKQSKERSVQFFLATHSPVFLNQRGGDVSIFRVRCALGTRTVERCDHSADVFFDLGMRPSDLLQNDLCLMVEGQDDVVFYEHVVKSLYAAEFLGVSVGVVQFGGGSALGIASGALSVANLTAARTDIHWVCDRDAAPSQPPSPDATRLHAALVAAGQRVTMPSKREVEFYVPVQVYVAAQNRDAAKEQAVRDIHSGTQTIKFRKALGAVGCTTPRGTDLKALLEVHCSRGDLDADVVTLLEQELIPRARVLRGT